MGQELGFFHGLIMLLFALGLEFAQELHVALEVAIDALLVEAQEVEGGGLGLEGLGVGQGDPGFASLVVVARGEHVVLDGAGPIESPAIDTAERYLLYEHVEAYKAASQLQEHASKLNARQFSDAGMEVLKKNRDILVAKYGKEFAGEYGWAFDALKRLDSTFNGRVKFDAIERCAAIGHMRPYYKMASNQVHAGPKGAAFTLGSIGRKKINLGL